MIASLIAFPRMFIRHARAFFAYTGRHLFALVALNIVMSYAEGIGIALFFPLLRSDGGQDALSLALASVIRSLHIDPSPTGVLPFIVATFILKGLLMLGTYSYQGYLAAQVPRRLRRDLVSALGRIDYRHVVGTNTGFQSNLLVNEVAKVGYAFTQFVRVFPPALNILVFFGIVLWLDWRLTLMCAGMGLCAVAVLSVAGRVSFQASRTAVKENATISSLIIQTFQSFKYLRSTAALGSFQRKIGESADRLARAETHSSAASSLSLSIAQPLIVLFLAGLVYYRSEVQHEPLGSLFVLLLYLFRIMTELWSLQFSWQSFVAYLGPTELVYGSLADLEGHAEQTGTRAYEGLKTEIVLREVSFAYTPDRPILRNLNLRIACNSTVAFVGESGSGKSTLIDLIMGTLKPTSGSVEVDGIPLAELDLETVRRRLGYVPQDALLFDDTIANNISLWSPATEAQILDAARRAMCLDFIEAMPERLESPIGDRGAKLSGGQRQRLAIARELFKQPNILVLDEATSALDSESERAIKDSIDALTGQLTILIIAHRLSTIRNCGHICVVAEGRIVEEGSYAELLARPGSRFARLCQLQELTQGSVSAP